jgi:hypothetical protein
VPWFRQVVAASHHGSPGQFMWDLWWTKWHWHRFLSEFFGFTQLLSILSYHVGDEQ